MTITAGAGIEIQINIVNGALPIALPAGTPHQDVRLINTGILANANPVADAAVTITVGGAPLTGIAGWAKTNEVGTLRFTPVPPVVAPGAGAPLAPGAGVPAVVAADAANKVLAALGIDPKALETQFAAFQQAADNMESGPEYDALVTKAVKVLEETLLNNNNVPGDKKAEFQGIIIKTIVDANNKSPLPYNTVEFDAIVHRLYNATKPDASTARIEHMLNNSENFTPTALVSAIDTAVTREEKQHEKVASTVAAVAEHATAAVATAVAGATTRLVAISPTFSSPMNAPVSGVDLEASANGVAAGDSTEKFGAWAQINGGVANQKARKGASGFKSNMVGSMIGVDTMVNDRTILGIAFGNIINNVKQKDIQDGDKTRSTSWIFSGYGNYQFDDNWFIRGAAAYTKTAVDNKDLRVVTANQKGIARGKYNIHSFGGELTVGKAFRMQNDLVMTPSLGARFAHTGKISYQETGNTGLNGKVSQGSTDSAQAVAGLQVMKSFARNNTIITPEAHANVAYGLGVKTPKGKYVSDLDSKTVAYRGNKPGRVSSTIGVGITAESGSVEYGIGYDANIAAGYLGHQGSLKLKVKF